MRNITFLSPWAVRYSEANGCFIVYVPSGSIVGGKCDVSSLTSALSPNANSGAGDTAKQTAKLTNWFQIDAASFSYSGDIIAAFVRKEENEEQGGETSEEGDAEETPDDTTDDEEEDSPSTDNEELALSDAYVVSFHTDTSSIPENAISVILASVSYDAQSESTSITQYVVGAITLPEKREEKDQLAVAWMVRRKPEEKSTTDDTDSDKNDGKADETESETPKKTAWQVYSPIWTWGKGLELLVAGMQEGWNDIPAGVASGTLYAVVELRGTKDGLGNIAWNPKEMTLKNTLDGLEDSDPTGEGSSAEPGVRWLAVRIGSFPEVGTSLSPEDDRRPFNQLHIGVIVENLYSGSSYGSYDIVSGLRYDASSHKLVCLVRTWNGQTLGVPHDGPGLVLSAYSVTKSTLLWSGNVLTRMDNTVSLRLFEAPTESGGAAEAIFATAPHEADESTPYEGDLSGLATSDATI